MLKDVTLYVTAIKMELENSKYANFGGHWIFRHVCPIQQKLLKSKCNSNLGEIRLQWSKNAPGIYTIKWHLPLVGEKCIFFHFHPLPKTNIAISYIHPCQTKLSTLYFHPLPQLNF